MRRALSIVYAAAWLALAGPPAHAQLGATVGFRSELKAPVIVQGYSVVNGVPRKGPPVVLGPGRIGLDNNVPPGPRFYNVYDANQPARVLLRDFPLSISGNDLLLLLRPAPANPNRVLLLPDGQ